MMMAPHQQRQFSGGSAPAGCHVPARRGASLRGRRFAADLSTPPAAAAAGPAGPGMQINSPR